MPEPPEDLGPPQVYAAQDQDEVGPQDLPGLETEIETYGPDQSPYYQEG